MNQIVSDVLGAISVALLMAALVCVCAMESATWWIMVMVAASVVTGAISAFGDTRPSSDTGGIGYF